MLMSVKKYCKIILITLFLNIKVYFVVGIIGGCNITIDEAPYQVNFGDRCGGVLIHKEWALTAAHCGTETNFIRIGSQHRLLGKKVEIIFHKVHPKYGYEHQFDYDVQLLKLRRGLHFHKRVSSLIIGIGECGDHFNLSGWGYSSEMGDYEENLKQIQLEIKHIETCQTANNYWYNYTLTPRMFCAGGDRKDACQGDSGGGAVASGYLVGISSFGYGCNRGIPGVYINVSDTEIRSWISYFTGI